MQDPAVNPISSDAKSSGSVSNSARPAYRGPRWARARLKFVAALRGRGELIWSGGAITAAYEIDLFANGDQRSASGNLDGDFSAVPPLDDTPVEFRLRLDDGREVPITVIDLEADGAEFETTADLSAAAV